jgi:hypothetical protein
VPSAAGIADEKSVDMNILVADYNVYAIGLIFRPVKDFYLDVVQMVPFACWALKLCAEPLVILIECWLHRLPLSGVGMYRAKVGCSRRIER